MTILNELQKGVLYLYIYGDLHHFLSERLEQGEKIISDGGSNIHTNFLLKIKDKFNITIYTYKDNYQVRIFFSSSPNIKIKEFATLSGLFKRCLLKIEVTTRCFYPGLTFLFRKLDYKYLITQTDFLPDTFSAFLAKIRNPQIQWVSSFFLTAPKPWDKKSPYCGKRWLIGFFYWLLQQPSIWFIKTKADKVLVTSEPDVKRFLNKKRDESKIIVVQGGVDIIESEKYLRSGEIIPVDQRKYDGCFVGRFHPQKGTLELIDIWKIVCDKRSKARLALIGGGPLENEVKEKIQKLGLQDNIDLPGFRYGEEKYKIFKQSKIVLHPATYDSGGMAACEAMAWGLPGVSFDLEALKTYYPIGMLKTPCYDLKAFAENIIRLLSDEDLYRKTSEDALVQAREWDWDKRSEVILDRVIYSGNK